MLYRGDRVLAKGEPGTVVYVRFAPPAFCRAVAVSVLLDKHRRRPGYSGTIFSRDDVRFAFTERGEGR